MDKAEIPKFGSFRSKKPERSKSTPKTDVDESKHSQDSSRKEKYSLRYNSDHSRQHSELRSLKVDGDTAFGTAGKSASEERSRVKYGGPSTSLWSSESENFVVDRRGDTSNQIYGSISRYSIPSYRPVGQGSSLGEVERSGRVHSNLLSRLGNDDRKKLRQKPKFIQQLQNGWDNEDEFVSLQPAKRRKVSREVLGLSKVSHTDADDDRPTISSGSASEIEKTPQNSESESDSELNKDADQLQLRQTHERLLTFVKREPENSSAWLEYIDFQNVWVAHGQEADEHHSKEEKRKVAPVKLSMYSKALKAVRKTDPNRELLLLGMMEEAAISLEVKRLASKWEETLRAESHYPNLWLRYLDHIQTNSSSYSFEAVQNVYKRSMRVLNDLASEFSSSDAAIMTRFTSGQIHVFLRFTTFARDSGYEELAVAAWQGLLELNFFRPILPDKDNEEAQNNSQVLQDFEKFWDAGHPRLGEQGSRGWRNVASAEPPLPVVVSKQVTELGLAHDQTRFARWARAEQICTQPIPRRTTDDLADEDPFQVVFFSDFQEFLFLVPEEHQRDLIDALLTFQGLPLLPDSSTTGYAWRQDALALNSFENSYTRDQSLTLNILNELENWETSSEILFNPAHELYTPFKHIETENVTGNSARASSKTTLICNILSNLIVSLPTFEALTEYYLALEMQVSPAAALKNAKKLLKGRQSSLRLYNIYALINARCSEDQRKAKVFETAIGMSVKLSSQEQEDVVYLWRSWVWEALRAGNNETALRRLIFVGTGTVNTSAPGTYIAPSLEDTDTATATFSEGHAFSASSGEHARATLYIELLALLSYLTTNRGFVDALRTFENYSILYFPPKSHSNPAPHHVALLHQAQAHLIHHHISQIPAAPYSPTLVRHTLATSIRLFPANTIFLTLYGRNESHFRLNFDRVRAVAQENLLSTSNNTSKFHYATASSAVVTRAAFTLRAELTRPLPLPAITNATRAAFEHWASHFNIAVTANVNIWAAYVYFELDRGEVQRAVNVFFRGLRCLPWHKGFTMIAFENERLGEALGRKALKELFEGMGMKGLRVRVELDEIE